MLRIASPEFIQTAQNWVAENKSRDPKSWIATNLYDMVLETIEEYKKIIVGAASNIAAF